MNTEESNREAVRIIFEEVWNKRGYDKLDGLVAWPAKLHFRNQEWTFTLDAVKAMVESWHSAFSNLHFEIGHLLAEDDTVAVRLTMSGKHDGTWEGIAATGNDIKFSEMMFFRFENGLIVEMWEDYDELGLLRQIGGVQ